jgi:small subunit ribosomal protein S3e
LRQGVLGVKVKIMRDPATNRNGPTSLPDYVKIQEPKDEESPETPSVKSYIQKPEAVAEEAAEATEA